MKEDVDQMKVPRRWPEQGILHRVGCQAQRSIQVILPTTSGPRGGSEQLGQVGKRVNQLVLDDFDLVVEDEAVPESVAVESQRIQLNFEVSVSCWEVCRW